MRIIAGKSPGECPRSGIRYFIEIDGSWREITDRILHDLSDQPAPCQEDQDGPAQAQ